MQLSLRWAERSKRAFESAPSGYMLFGIVQGGDVPALRQQSARGLVEIGFHGYAIGGLAVGEPQAVMLAMIEETAPVLPADRPRYLMGVGTPEDHAGGGGARHRHVRLRDADPERTPRHGVHPVRPDQSAQRAPRRRSAAARRGERLAVGANISRAYLHHLVRSGETLGAMLLSEINIAYYQHLMQGMREAIAQRHVRGISKSKRAPIGRAVTSLPR